MDYPTLFRTIQAYVENDFPDTVVLDNFNNESSFGSKEQIDTFIRNAEERIYNSVQLLSLRRNVTSTLTAGDLYVNFPDDWLATYSLAVIDGDGDYEYLLNKDVNFIREAYPNPNTRAKPQYYAMFDTNTALICPTPDQAYSVEMHYFYYPASIVTATRSWLGDNYDSVLLYGCLLEAYTFMKGEQDVNASYQKRYDEGMAMLKQLSDGKNRQDMYRTRQARYPVQ